MNKEEIRKKEKEERKKGREREREREDTCLYSTMQFEKFFNEQKSTVFYFCIF